MNLFSRRDFIIISASLFATSFYADDALPKVPTVDQALSEAAKEAPLRWKFAGNTPEDLASWQRQFRTKLGKISHQPHEQFRTNLVNNFAPTS